MGWYEKARKYGKKAVGTAFNNMLTKPLGNWMADSPLGTFWDTHIGREGLIGGLGDLTGLWESGTTADTRRDALDANTDYINQLEQRKQDALPDAVKMMNMSNLVDSNQFGGLLGGISSGGLATDNSRAMEQNRLITNAINKQNLKFDRTVEDAQAKSDALDDNIYIAEQQRQDLT